MQKSQIIELLEKMPSDVAIGDFIAEIYFREKLDSGLKQIENGKTISHEEAKKRLSKWLS